MFLSLFYLSSCAESNAKRVSLELGGKSPLIIFGDSDLDKAVRQVRSLLLTLSVIVTFTLVPWSCLF